MRRLILAGAMALVAAPAASATTTSGHPYLRAFMCQRSLVPAQRVVSVTAVMPTMPGTERVQMRFQLLRRSAGTSTTVRGGDLGRWISPASPTLGQQPKDVWIVRHPVTGVPVPGSYRFRVSFRWIGVGGRTLGTIQRTGQRCWQPDMRPDPLVGSIDVQPIAGDPSHDQYVAQIYNGGLSGARNVEVRFAAGAGGSTQSITIPRLRSHTTFSATFAGPACTAATAPTVTVDPANRVNDLNRANNSLTAGCP